MLRTEQHVLTLARWAFPSITQQFTLGYLTLWTIYTVCLGVCARSRALLSNTHTRTCTQRLDVFCRKKQRWAMSSGCSRRSATSLMVPEIRPGTFQGWTFFWIWSRQVGQDRRPFLVHTLEPRRHCSWVKAPPFLSHHSLLSQEGFIISTDVLRITPLHPPPPEQSKLFSMFLSLSLSRVTARWAYTRGVVHFTLGFAHVIFFCAFHWHHLTALRARKSVSHKEPLWVFDSVRTSSKQSSFCAILTPFLSWFLNVEKSRF